jgi:hypothetical protein
VTFESEAADNAAGVTAFVEEMIPVDGSYTMPEPAEIEDLDLAAV